MDRIIIFDTSSVTENLGDFIVMDYWMSSMLPMLAICSSSRIFSRRAFSSGVRFFLAICKTSCVVLLFYTMKGVYTKLEIASNLIQITNIPFPSELL